MPRFTCSVSLLLTIVMLASFTVDAQKPRKLYYNKYWELTVPDSALFYRDCTIDTVGNTFAGVFTDYYADGAKLTTGTYLDGKRQGSFSTWYRNGQLESEGNFLGERQNGIWKYFYPNGRERQEVIFYDSGFRVNSFYDSTSRQLVSNGTGHWYEFYEEYKLDGLLSNEGDFVNGNKQGTWTTSYNGVPIVRETFHDGKFVGGVEIDGDKTTSYTREILNKLLPHYKFSVTEKWRTDKGSANYYPFLFAGDKDKTFVVVEQPAEFVGGIAAMSKFIMTNLKYPKEARRRGIEGVVFVSFIVDQGGSISNVEVVKGIGSGCDEEAVRLVSSFPTWNPGRQNGRAIKSKFVLPVKFRGRW